MERSDRANTILLLGGMALLCVALSHFFFMAQSLRLDEAQSLWQSSRSPGDILTIVSQDVHVPLYHELLHFWRLTFGDTVTAARALSMLFYLLCLPAIYLLGKLTYGRKIGLFAAFLLAISPFMNWYGNEIRMYTLLTFVMIINQYFYIKILTRGKLLQGTDAYTGAWIGYALSAILGVFVHYFFFLGLLAQAVFYFMRSDLFPAKSLRNFILVASGVIVLFGPWLWYVYIQGQAGFQQPLLPAPTTVNLFNAFSQFLFGFQNDNLNTFFLSLWPITLIFGFFALRKNMRLSPVSVYLIVSVVVSVSVAFVVSFWVPIFVSRYLIFTVPALYLLLTNFFESYTPRSATLARAGVALVMLIALGIEIGNPTTPVKEDYAAAASYMQQHATVQDVVVLSAPFTVYPVEYYYRGLAPVATLPLWDQYSYGPIPPFSAQKLPTEAAQATDSYQNVWLLLSYDQGYQSTVKDYFDSHYRLVLSKNFSPGLDLYEYQLRYDTARAQASSTALAH